jgi:hypothetical protein
MNKAHGRHMGASAEELDANLHGKPPAEKHEGRSEHEHSEGEKPHIIVHSHAKGHTVHVMHSDGTHEKHEHESGDTEGIKAHVDTALGGGEGQDHGFSGGEEEEDEFGAGPGV